MPPLANGLAAVLGVGLNVTTETFPAHIADTATSLRQAGVDATPDRVLGDLLPALSRWLEAPPDAILAAWRARCAQGRTRPVVRPRGNRRA
jgi:biotin-(acetyl-CoA carboxylase) ligase